MLVFVGLNERYPFWLVLHENYHHAVSPIAAALGLATFSRKYES
jgi:hypothetical protein